jgi:hypothetical protein
MVDKNHIISEIQRTAAENGGAPLGKKRFSAASGIRYTDWYGKHWVRWGDALKEAGFTPNKPQTAYDDDFLLSKLAAAAREYRHFPLVAELEMKSRREPGFPHRSTFRRLGNKTEMAAKLLKFCLERGYEDVAEMCRAVGALESPPLDCVEHKPHRAIGEVYLFKSGPYYKVGRSRAACCRGRELATQLPERGNVIHVIKTDDAPGIELYWHRRFSDRRKNGEWFDLNSQDVMAFKRRKFM